MAFHSLLLGFNPSSSRIVLSDQLKQQSVELLAYTLRTWIESPKVKYGETKSKNKKPIDVIN
jgi:hypothetical protein